MSQIVLTLKIACLCASDKRLWPSRSSALYALVSSKFMGMLNICSLERLSHQRQTGSESRFVGVQGSKLRARSYKVVCCWLKFDLRVTKPVRALAVVAAALLASGRGGSKTCPSSKLLGRKELGREAMQMSCFVFHQIGYL